MLALVITGCSNDGGPANSTSGTQRANRGEHDHDGEHGREGRGEHDRDGDDHHGEAGEESGIELALNDTYDHTRNGARLILAYDAKSNSFIGTVENTTDKTLDQVRVEVHLSNGKELGPTTPADLEPGKKMDVKLAAATKDFDGWTAHPEVGRGEHGREGRGEHPRRSTGLRSDVQLAEEETRVVIQIVKFETELSEDEVLATARDRLGDFRALPGLIQKYYVKLSEPNRYGGVYIWDSIESLSKFRASELAASIPREYKVKGEPKVEILDALFELRTQP